MSISNQIRIRVCRTVLLKGGQGCIVLQSNIVQSLR
jgi:hypothetical protein